MWDVCFWAARGLPVSLTPVHSFSWRTYEIWAVLSGMMVPQEVVWVGTTPSLTWIHPHASPHRAWPCSGSDMSRRSHISQDMQRFFLFLWLIWLIALWAGLVYKGYSRPTYKTTIVDWHSGYWVDGYIILSFRVTRPSKKHKSLMRTKDIEMHKAKPLFRLL